MRRRRGAQQAHNLQTSLIVALVGCSGSLGDRNGPQVRSHRQRFGRIADRLPEVRHVARRGATGAPLRPSSRREETTISRVAQPSEGGFAVQMELEVDVAAR